MENIVRVGVSVIIRKYENDKCFVLLGKRLKSHGAQRWATPGGHIEFGEHPIETARREVLEETGLELTEIKPSSVYPYVSTIFPEQNKHYITLYMDSEFPGNKEPVAMEPEKCDSWIWFDVDNLPSPLFTDTGMRQAITQRKESRTFEVIIPHKYIK